MVAGHVQPGQGAQPLSCLEWQKRAAERVAQVDDLLHLAARDVVDNGLQRRQIAVNVRDQSQTHTPSCRFQKHC